MTETSHQIIVPDTSWFMEPISEVMLCLHSIFTSPIVILSLKSVRDELEQHSRNPVKQQAAAQWIRTLIALMNHPNIEVKIDKSPSTSGTHADPDILVRSKPLDALILTGDMGLARSAKEQSIRVLTTFDVMRSFQNILPQLNDYLTSWGKTVVGQLLKIRVEEIGSERNDGIGYLDNNPKHKVIILKGASYLNREVIIKIDHVSCKGLAFASIVGQCNLDPPEGSIHYLTKSPPPTTGIFVHSLDNCAS